jgi:NADH-quinone oxidoreductase subunit L
MFPVYCPVYDRIIPVIIGYAYIFNFEGDMNKWVSWLFFKTPIKFVAYMLYNDYSLFIKGFFVFLAGPLDSALWLEDYRAYVSNIDSKVIESYFIHSFIEATTQPITAIVSTITALIKNDQAKLALVMEGLYTIFDGVKYSFDFEWSKEDLFTYFTYSGILFTTTVLLSFIIANYLGLYGVFVASTFTLFLFWISCAAVTYVVWSGNLTHTLDFGKWFTVAGGVEVRFDFYLDNLSLAFALLVLSIAFFINLYTFAYFRYEPNTSRLILLIDVFVISMTILVLAGNIVVLYFGWEMIGITSFFLINFWSTRMGTVKAGFKAFVFNKISDCFMLLSIIIIYIVLNDFNILVINNSITLHAQTNTNMLQSNFSSIELLTFCWMVAAFIKSAQFGFHIWLPDSMEAPVPASALIHSATLVSAGIYLILRFYPVFELTPGIRMCILFMGSFTAFFGGICSIYQTDVKRLLAYSTISHCGVLMFLTFFKDPDMVIIYLYVHGFFKAIMFMCMGHVIRFANNYQDMRRMGGFYKYLPFEAMLSFIGLINLGGVSFSWGFYMKHFLILEATPESFFNLAAFTLILIGSLAGLIYSYKLYYYVFFDFKKGRKNVYFRIENTSNKNKFHTNASLASNISIILLTLTAYIICGYLIYSYIGDYSINFDWSLFSNFKNILKNFSTNQSLTIFYYINWTITIIVLFILTNNWKNNINQSFKIKFFMFCWLFAFFFYIFYTILLY